MIAIFILGIVAFVADPIDGISFDTEILPILTKVGCNAGACHGAAAGRGGMHLSLFGSDPEADFETLVQDMEGRRINTLHPMQSLMLRKSLGDLDHGGGEVLEIDSVALKRLSQWIHAGAPRGASKDLVHFSVKPSEVLLRDDSHSIALQATASFDNEQERDVTPWTLFKAADPSAVEIDRTGHARVLQCGEHVVIARYLNQVKTVALLRPWSERDVDLASEPRENFIDSFVLERIAQLRLPVSPLASDDAWLRRVTLDLTGRLPRPEDVRRFLLDQESDKKRRVVDTLLESEAFTDYWTFQLARMLRMHSLPNEVNAFECYRMWLREQIAADRPWNEIVSLLLESSGDSHSVGPANFHRMVDDARGEAELVSQAFAGIRLGCANCHNHPLDRWTQDDYHGLAGIFAKLNRSRIVEWTDRGSVTNLRTGETAIPRVPGVKNVSNEAKPIHEVLNWLLDPNNPLLARVMVNRLWKSMLGRGLVEPVDDLRATNPATHPELFDALTSDFMLHGYRIRHTLRTIALSSTYNRSDQSLAGNAVEDRFYSHAYSHPLEPAVLADAIADVTGVSDSFEVPSWRFAIHAIDSSQPVATLDVLGRCRGSSTTCGEGQHSAVGLATQLHWINGEMINKKIQSPEGRLHQAIHAGRSNDSILQELFERCWSARLNEEELERWSSRISDNPSERIKQLEDIFWSLLNSRAFRNRH